MLLLLGGGELPIIFWGILPSLDSCHLVNFFLRYNSPHAGIGSTLLASPTSPMALSATSATLESRDIAGLIGRGFSLLHAHVINIELHHCVKLLKLMAVNHYCALDRGNGWISDPVFEVIDLHGLFKGLHIPFGQSSMAIVLLHMGSAVLVKNKILVVTTVVQAF
jgi:hypothetical protein